MKKLNKSHSKPKTKRSRISKRNPETIEEQLKKLENQNVDVYCFDLKTHLARTVLTGLLINDFEKTWHIRNNLGEVVFNLDLDIIDIDRVHNNRVNIMINKPIWGIKV